MTFNLTAGILASLSPVVESDPIVLNDWADNLDRIADAFDLRSAHGLAVTKRNRANYLRSLARRA